MRLRLPAAGVTDVLALRALFAHQHECFLAAVARYDLDQALERWTPDAIVWMPDRMPVCGRQTIRRLLVDDGCAALGAFRMEDLRVTGGAAYETGTISGFGRRLGYLALWSCAVGGVWRISREIWDV